MLNENKFNMKTFSTILKQAIGILNDKYNFLDSVCINSQNITKRSKVAGELDNYFIKIGMQILKMYQKQRTNIRNILKP